MSLRPRAMVRGMCGPLPLSSTAGTGDARPVSASPVSRPVTTTHKTLVAALSAAADTGAVLRTALGFAALVGTGLEALHVAEDTERTGDPHKEAHVAGVRVHQRHGPVADRILDALASPRVFGAVMGARRSIAGPRPVGSAALQVLCATVKPVIFVPPEASGAGEFAPRRLVVPLDGSAAASSALLGIEGHFRPDANRETIVLYVLNGLTPRMVDRPGYDLPLWGEEFLCRYCPGEHRSFEWSTGDPGNAVIDLAGRAEGDLIVLSFGGDIDLGHGAVVQEVLARASIPVLVVPTPARATRVRRSAARH
jgi:hypothetical protein